MAGKRPDYTVTGKYVTAKTMTTDGWRVVGLHEGAQLPPDVPEEDVAHLLRKGLVAEVGNEPVPPADMDAHARAEYADAVVLAAETELEKAKDRLKEAKAAQDSAHEAVDAAEREREERDKPKGATTQASSASSARPAAGAGATAVKK
jgi:hypothetical protein